MSGTLIGRNFNLCALGCDDDDCDDDDDDDYEYSDGISETAEVTNGDSDGE